MRHVSILCTLVVLLPLGGSAIQGPNPQLGAGKERLPILVQGAMPVETAQLVKRLQQVGTIGNNRGMYDAHLHFEIRKNLQIGMHRSSFARDFSNYWDPTTFIVARPTLASGGRLVSVPINTFAATPPPPAYASAVEEGFRLATPPRTGTSTSTPAVKGSSPRGPFKVDRYGDMKQ
jgi:hypothetical protein